VPIYINTPPAPHNALTDNRIIIRIDLLELTDFKPTTQVLRYSNLPYRNLRCYMHER